MGVLPLRFPAGENREALGIDGSEELDLSGLSALRPHGPVTVRLRRRDGSTTVFEATAAVETAREVEYLRAGGVLPFIMDRLVRESAR